MPHRRIYRAYSSFLGIRGIIETFHEEMPYAKSNQITARRSFIVQSTRGLDNSYSVPCAYWFRIPQLRRGLYTQKTPSDDFADHWTHTSKYFLGFCSADATNPRNHSWVLAFLRLHSSPTCLGERPIYCIRNSTELGIYVDESELSAYTYCVICTLAPSFSIFRDLSIPHCIPFGQPVSKN